MLTVPFGGLGSKSEDASTAGAGPAAPSKRREQVRHAQRFAFQPATITLFSLGVGRIFAQLLANTLRVEPIDSGRRITSRLWNQRWFG